MASIEAARALAAVAVVLMHAANLMSVEHFSGHIGMGRVFDFGYVGVDFFLRAEWFHNHIYTLRRYRAARHDWSLPLAPLFSHLSHLLVHLIASNLGHHPGANDPRQVTRV